MPRNYRPTYPLDLFVLESPSQISTGFESTACSLPAKTKDGANISLLGTLVQIGDAKVIRFTPPDACKVMPPSSSAFKVTAYRVHFTSQEWSDFSAHPVRSAIAKIPTLATDSKKLIDYWDHRRTSNQYSFKIRVNESVSAQVRRDSGSMLIFLDDLPDEVGQKPNWVVVWLPDHTLDQIKAKAQMHSTSSGIVVKNPGPAQIFGLRVLARHAVELRGVDPKAAKNDGYVFIGRRFILQPQPAGCDQETIAQILASVKWNARPLKPAGRHSYRVGSSEDPPCDRIQHVSSLKRCPSQMRSVGTLSQVRRFSFTLHPLSPIPRALIRQQQCLASVMLRRDLPPGLPKLRNVLRPKSTLCLRASAHPPRDRRPRWLLFDMRPKSHSRKLPNFMPEMQTSAATCRDLPPHLRPSQSSSVS